MFWLSRLWRNVVNRERTERELDDEVRGTLDMLIAERMEAGFPPDEARRAVSMARARRSDESRPPFDEFDADLLQQSGDAAVQATDKAILPLHRLGKVETRRGERNAERTFAQCQFRDPGEFFGGMDQRLGRYAANVEAGAARFVCLHHDSVDAELSRHCAVVRTAPVAKVDGADDAQGS